MNKEESQDKLIEIINQFISDSNEGNLKTKKYPKNWDWTRFKVSFGKGTPAGATWIAFLGPGMEVSKGIYPCYLYYKDKKKLILSYGVSEENEPPIRWPEEIRSKKQKIGDYFNEKNVKYKDSFA